VTEFDRLFRTGFESALKTVVNARGAMPPARRRVPRFKGRPASFGPGPVPAFRRGRRLRPEAFLGRDDRDGATVSLVGAVVERYLDLWLRHAATMRLTAAEALNDSAVWSEARRFIHRYGGELFHARVLPLSNLRAILHEGVDKFLDRLVEEEDPLRPSPLAEALRADETFRRRAARLLELIYAAVVDEIERFVEYNSTTVQSDYGERFDSFLDFLKAEAAYRRDEWDLTPLRIAHEVLSAAGKGEAARLWEQVVRERTAAAADKHLARLASLEKRHAMRLPSISDKIAERFVKPFAVDRMVALVPVAVRDARAGRDDSPAFRLLRREIDAYITTSTGSAAELPGWIGQVEAAVAQAVEGPSGAARERETVTGRPIPSLRRGQVLRQVSRRRTPRRGEE
ncbi:MAG TPA: hypothetical protein VF170_13240, partial [Planctomycetaceae bacterium]